MTVCFDKAKQFAEELFEKDKPFSNSQLKDFIARLARRAQKIVADDPSKNIDEAIDIAANKFKDDARFDAEMTRKRAYLNVIAKRKNLDILKEHDFAPKALQKIIEKIDILQGATFTRRLMGGAEGLITRLRKEGLLERFHDNSIDLKLAKALRKETGVDDEQIQRIGDIINETYELARQIQNKHGANIGKLDDFMASQSHDPLKMLQTADTYRQHLATLGRLKGNRAAIREAAFERWHDFQILRLDHDRTFIDIPNTDEAKRKFLRGVFNNLVKGIHTKFDAASDEVGTYKRGVSFAKRLGPERKLFYKDAESQLQQIETYGPGSLNAAIQHTLERSSKNIGLLKSFGPDALNTFQELKKAVEAESTVPGLKGKLNKIDNIMAQIDGTSSSPVSYRGARVSSNIRSFIGLSRLGLVVPTSFSDIATVVSTMRFNGVGFLDAWHEGLTNLLKIFSKKTEQREVLDLLGTAADSMIGTTNRFSLSDSPAGMISNLDQLFYKLNLLKSWDHIHREGTVSMLSRLLALKKDTSWGALGEDMQNALSLYSINKNEWDLIRTVPTKLVGNKEFITPDAIRLATKENIAKFLGKDGGDVSKSEMTRVQDEMEDSLMMYFHDNANHSILQPTAADRAIFIRGQSFRPGTVAGEAVRFLAQFKMYSTAFARRIIGRNVLGAASSRASVQALGELLVGTAILNYIGLSTRDLLANRTPVNPAKLPNLAAKVNFWTKVFAPGFGIWGDFIGGQYNSYGGGIIDQAGPVISDVNSLAKMFGQLKQGNNPSHAALQFLKGNIPFHNLWFTNAAFQYLVMHAIENRINPGAMQRAADRLNQTGQHYIISPF